MPHRAPSLRVLCDKIEQRIVRGETRADDRVEARAAKKGAQKLAVRFFEPICEMTESVNGGDGNATGRQIHPCPRCNTTQMPFGSVLASELGTSTSGRSDAEEEAEGKLRGGCFLCAFLGRSGRAARKSKYTGRIEEPHKVWGNSLRTHGRRRMTRRCAKWSFSCLMFRKNQESCSEGKTVDRRRDRAANRSHTSRNPTQGKNVKDESFSHIVFRGGNDLADVVEGDETGSDSIEKQDSPAMLPSKLRDALVMRSFPNIVFSKRHTETEDNEGGSPSLTRWRIPRASQMSEKIKEGSRMHQSFSAAFTQSRVLLGRKKGVVRENGGVEKQRKGNTVSKPRHHRTASMQARRQMIEDFLADDEWGKERQGLHERSQSWHSKIDADDIVSVHQEIDQWAPLSARDTRPTDLLASVGNCTSPRTELLNASAKTRPEDRSHAKAGSAQQNSNPNSTPNLSSVPKNSDAQRTRDPTKRGLPYLGGH